MAKQISLAVIALETLFIIVQASEIQPDIQYQWKYINYSWPSVDAYKRAVQDKSYIQKHNVMSGIKLWNDRMFLAVPRLRKGVPVTLTSIPLNEENGGLSPLLEPYPNWEMQQIGNCSALQFVQSMEIDPKGRMWVIDNGRIEIREEHPRPLCPSRLMIFDLTNNGTILLDYTFPEGRVVHFASVYLNDITIDHEDGGWAYITDNDKQDPGIVVFSLRDRRSWKVRHESMIAEPEAFQLVVNSRSLVVNSNVDGIALSPASTEGRNRVLYYSPQSSYKMFAMPTDILKNNLNPDRWVRYLGRKPSQSDGMITSASGILYFGLLAKNAICSWDTTKFPFSEQLRIIKEDAKVLEWPDSFAIDQRGYLWNTAKRQSVIRTSGIEMDRINFWIIRTEIQAMSYQYYEDGKVPILPEIQTSLTQILTLRALFERLLLRNLNRALLNV